MIFIDRFGDGGYKYHPLRLGEYLEHRIENEYVYFKIKLKDFVYPIDLDTFIKSVVQALGSRGLPVVTNTDPEYARDGYYALLSDSIFTAPNEFQVGDSAWGNAVQNLSSTRAFATTTEQTPVFLRLQVGKSGKKAAIEPLLKGGSALYRFKKNESYDLALTYRYPRQLTDHTSRASFKVRLGENLRPNEAPVLVDSHANSVQIRFAAKRYIDDDTGSIQMEGTEVSGQPILLLANSGLNYEIKEPKRFWAQLAIALLLLSIVSALLGLDFSSIQPLTASNLLCAVKPKLVLGIVQTAILFWVFRLIGKKIF
ncbi:MAG: hypothetical protein WCC92_06120 [Candidatus Korobacteraceae bacterium]